MRLVKEEIGPIYCLLESLEAQWERWRLVFTDSVRLLGEVEITGTTAWAPKRAAVFNHQIHTLKN